MIFTILALHVKTCTERWKLSSNVEGNELYFTQYDPRWAAIIFAFCLILEDSQLGYIRQEFTWATQKEMATPQLATFGSSLFGKIWLDIPHLVSYPKFFLEIQSHADI